MLFGGGLLTMSQWRLSLMMYFLGSKDLIQALMYQNLDNPDRLRILGTLSWIHISLQPLCVNAFLSQFSAQQQLYRNAMIAAAGYAVVNALTLKELDPFPLPPCIHDGNFCSSQTGAYQGRYHIGYTFERDRLIEPFYAFYFTAMFWPLLFLKRARAPTLIWIFLVIVIYTVFNDIREGEQAAIWCFLSIIYMLPLAIAARYRPAGVNRILQTDIKLDTT